MGALFMLIGIGIIVLWLVLSPMFGKIGKKFDDTIAKLTEDDAGGNNGKEEEK